MPFERHKTFVPASNSESTLWRYMSLPKYLFLLQKKSLFFSNLELMSRSDPFEGTLPASQFKHRKWQSVHDVPAHLCDYIATHGQSLSDGLVHYKNLAEHKIKQAYLYRRSYFINCWHLSEYESSAMWNIYSHRDEGIAILSSEAQIEAALANNTDSIFGGRINYGDYGSADFVMDDQNAFTPILHKRMSFSYEAEYRLVSWDVNVIQKIVYAENGLYNIGGVIFSEEKFPNGISIAKEPEEINQIDPVIGHEIDCDINKLISKVYVSPLAPDWFLEVVKSVSKSYGLVAPVIKSKLLEDPLK